jgi:hypothetical protein
MLAGIISRIVASDMGVRCLALTFCRRLRLRLRLCFDQGCTSELELLFTMCGDAGEFSNKRLTPKRTA